MNINDVNLLKPIDLITLSGATTAVYFSTQVMRYVFNLNPRIIGLIFSFLISFISLFFSENISFMEIFVCIPNAFIIFTISTGLATIASQFPHSDRHNGIIEEIDIEEIDIEKSFWDSWY